MAGAAAWLIVKLRWAIVVAWVAAAAVVTVQLPDIGEAQAGALGDLVPNDAEALDAELRSAEEFAFPLLSRSVIVQRDPDGLSAREQLRVAERATALNQGEYPGLRRVAGALPFSNTLGEPPFSRESSTTALTYLFFEQDVSQPDRRVLARRLIERRIEPDYDGFAGTTGALAARAEQAAVIEDSLPVVELATVLLVLLIVGAHFRGVGAPLVALAAVAIAYLISIRLVATIGREAGFSVPSEVEPVMVVLLFGIVTDYSIFFLSGVRRRLEQGARPRTAAVEGTAPLLPIIFTAGLTVAAATATLLVAQLGFFQAFGPGMSLTLLIGLAVSITFVPAALAIGGHRLFWPARPGSPSAASEDGREARRRIGRHRAVAVATRWPLATVVVCAAVLLAGAYGLTRIELGNPVIRGLPADSAPREAYRQASSGFAPGILAPTVLLVEGRDLDERRRALARFQRLVEDQPGVAEVVGPADSPVGRVFGAVISRDRRAARYFVVFAADPYGARAIRALRRLQRRAPALLVEAGLTGVDTAFAGDTALSAETIDEAVGDVGRVAPAALLAVFLILAIFLRAVVAPLYLVASSLLALLASLGLTTIFFQDLVAQQDIAYFVPFAAAVLLLSLGSDYNVFLTGGIWQEARERPLREAVRVAASRAATPIAIAGIVLAASFALLAVVPIGAFRQLAFAMAVGLVIDAFVVRTLLVPALITLVGSASGWPGHRLDLPERSTATVR